MNFKDDILEEAAGETIEAIVIGAHGKTYAEPAPGRLLSWHDAAPLLDYEYYDGYGIADCHAIYAWTATKVIIVSEYDGSTKVRSVPRHPIPCDPDMI